MEKQAQGGKTICPTLYSQKAAEHKFKTRPNAKACWPQAG